MMFFRSATAAGSLRISFVTGCVVALASCSTVTYGTGTPTATQTLRDIAGVVDIIPDPTVINYEQRNGIEMPASASLPPPQPAADPAPQQPRAAPSANRCAIAPGQIAPPAEYCVANPNAPEVVAANGLFANADTSGIREPANPCSWYTLSWAQMTADEQAEWAKLGWNVSNWGSADPALMPPSAIATWSDLTFAERRAARQLGFDDNSWGACLI